MPGLADQHRPDPPRGGPAAHSHTSDEPHCQYGKNHNVPDWHTSQAGPFDLWPTGLGFEYFYGFLGGDANQWHTALYENTRPVEAEEQRGDHPVHFDQLMADHAITWLRMQHAVEGLSVAAISYYVLSLLGVALKALHGVGFPVEPEVGEGLLILPVGVGPGICPMFGLRVRTT